MDNFHNMQPFNYDDIAQYYDQLELDVELNASLVSGLSQIFREHQVKKIWDAACGTGAQSLPLAAAGFEVIASDLSPAMLRCARNKKALGKVSFSSGDIRNFCPGTVDAVISLYNALGHLSRSDLKKALVNAAGNLRSGGLFVGDFDNRSFLVQEGVLTDQFYMSGEGVLDDKPFKRLTRALIGENGCFEICDRWLVDEELLYEATWDLQTWSQEELEQLATDCGYEIIHALSRGAGELAPKSERDSFLLIFKKLY